MLAVRIGPVFWGWFVLVGAAGFGIGLGLVVGAFTVKELRHFMRDEGLNRKKDD